MDTFVNQEGPCADPENVSRGEGGRRIIVFAGGGLFAIILQCKSNKFSFPRGEGTPHHPLHPRMRSDVNRVYCGHL